MLQYVSKMITIQRIYVCVSQRIWMVEKGFQWLFGFNLCTVQTNTRVFPSQEPVNTGYKSLPLPRACKSRLQESSPPKSLWIQATRVFPSHESVNPGYKSLPFLPTACKSRIQEPVNPGYKSLPLPRACKSRLQESSQTLLFLHRLQNIRQYIIPYHKEIKSFFWQ